MREKEAELGALRATVAALTARVALLEARDPMGEPGDMNDMDAPARGWRTQRPGKANSGFGRFDSSLLSSRSGQGDSSPFDLIRAVARS